MIKVKSVFDPVERDDGLRIWVEPIGLTRDLQQWCDVDYVLPQIGPPLRVWNELRQKPDSYDYFATKYHAFLNQEPRRATLAQLVALSASRDITLLHEGDDPHQNSAVVLFEFLSAWQERADR
jgi:uncharacterized protein YeaO (DUF488 family)